MSRPWILPLAVAALATVACASSKKGFDTPDPAGTDGTDTPDPAGTGTGGDFDTTAPPPDAPDPTEVSEVFGHSADTLYKLDPQTNAVTTVGEFDGCDRVTDIALDSNSTLYATSYTTLYTVDRTTAKCTLIHDGTDSYPNSLSFVPKGTVDANAEALVGFQDADYVRIDTKTGKITTIGSLGNGGYVSSGDIVSVQGGATYLTVKGGSCDTQDCLVEIDPKSGAIKKKWGSVEHHNVFGISFWGGKVYGFDDSGELFEVTFGSSQLATTPIDMPGKPTGLSFWGAGSSTAAPLVAPTK